MLRMYDIIQKKRDGLELSEEEISVLIREYTKKNIPDYQMSAFLMAVYFRGMTAAETTALTMAMASSGDTIDLSRIKGVKVDKHSTGGVGDKTTLIVGPMVAACGVSVAKMSGKGLGHTGGTIDKLESIPGLKTTLSSDAFFDIVQRVGICVAGQSGDLAPADKMLYALRDVTATVDSIPLIAASIMSKKLAAGSDKILLDIKTGSGAFMKNTEDAIELAKIMVDIGERAGKQTVAIVTDMNAPLGHCIGNSLEIIECIQALSGSGSDELMEVCVELAVNMLQLAGIGSESECRKRIDTVLANGAALKKLREMIEAQGGSFNLISDIASLPSGKFNVEITSKRGGYITSMDTEGIGIACSILGAGRQTKDDVIDYGAGIILRKKLGEEVQKNETLAVLYSSDTQRLMQAERKFMASLTFSNKPVKPRKMIIAKISKENIDGIN